MRTFIALTAILLPLAAPAIAGPTEDAVALCKAQALQQFGPGEDAPALRIRSIEPGGKATRVRIAARSAARTLDCRVDFRGRLISASFDEGKRRDRVESAARQP